MSEEPEAAAGRILVVEDNFLMAEVVCDFLRSCGLEPVGPAPSIERGLHLAREEALDGAVLDINLRDGTCFPICAELTRRRVPFIFLSGYSSIRMVPNEFRTARHIEKPFSADELQAVLLDMLARQRMNRRDRMEALARAAV